MCKPGQFLTAALLSLLATPVFAAELLISNPQDEHIDPASSYTMTVRPGDKVSLVAALYDRISNSAGQGWTDRGHRSDEFEWQPGCDSSSPACPTITITPGQVAVTINVPICFPVGTTHITVVMPVPPQGEGAPAAARVSLTNTEQPSICPGGNSSPRAGSVVTTSAVNANPEAQAAENRASAEKAGASSSGYGGRSGPAAEAERREQIRRAYEQAYFEAHQYSNNSQRGFNYGDPEAASAVVMSCAYRGNKLLCRKYVPLKKKKTVRKVKAKRVVKRRR